MHPGILIRGFIFPICLCPYKWNSKVLVLEAVKYFTRGKALAKWRVPTSQMIEYKLMIKVQANFGFTFKGLLRIIQSFPIQSDRVHVHANLFEDKCIASLSTFDMVSFIGALYVLSDCHIAIFRRQYLCTVHMYCKKCP